MKAASIMEQLPTDLAEQILAECRATRDKPIDVIVDALQLYFDEFVDGEISPAPQVDPKACGKAELDGEAPLTPSSHRQGGLV